MVYGLYFCVFFFFFLLETCSLFTSCLVGDLWPACTHYHVVLSLCDLSFIHKNACYFSGTVKFGKQSKENHIDLLDEVVPF